MALYFSRRALALGCQLVFQPRALALGCQFVFQPRALALGCQFVFQPQGVSPRLTIPKPTRSRFVLVWRTSQTAIDTRMRQNQRRRQTIDPTNRDRAQDPLCRRRRPNHKCRSQWRWRRQRRWPVSPPAADSRRLPIRQNAARRRCCDWPRRQRAHLHHMGRHLESGYTKR